MELNNYSNSSQLNSLIKMIWRIRKPINSPSDYLVCSFYCLVLCGNLEHFSKVFKDTVLLLH